MPSTPFQNNSHSITIAGQNFRLDTRTNVDSFSRTDNRLTVTGASMTVRVNSASAGSWFSGYTVTGMMNMPGGERRVDRSLGSGTFNRGSSYTTSPKVNFTVTVGADATTIYTNNGVAVASLGSGWGEGQQMAIPAVGAPTGSNITATSITHNSATLNASLTQWGTNATAGDGQRIEYRKAGGTWTNLAYSKSLSHSRNLTGLDSNARYEMRTYAKNGAGKTQGSGTKTFDTRSQVTSEGSRNIQSTSITFTNAKATQGQNTTTSKVQYRLKGDSTWIDSETKTGGTFTIHIDGLLPSTTYQYRFTTSTSAGATNNATKEFTTLPAGKIIYPNGSVVNAIPWIIKPDGSKVMAQMKKI